MQPEPFEDSRRLTGANLYFAVTGAALETVRGLASDDDGALERWRGHIAAARAALGWPDDATIIRRHRSGASLAFAAPFDQLYAATEVNEWAWWRSIPAQHEENTEAQAYFHAPGHAAVWDTDSALHTLQHLAASESRPALLGLRQAADTQAVTELRAAIAADDYRLAPVNVGQGVSELTAIEPAARVIQRLCDEAREVGQQ